MGAPQIADLSSPLSIWLSAELVCYRENDMEADLGGMVREEQVSTEVISVR